MNKSAIALAIAAALTASAVAHAETTLYGSARGSVTWVDPDGDDTDDFWDVRNHSSRLGVRGAEDLGNGLSVIYQYEFGVDITEGGNFNSNRPRVLGLKGGFGQVSIGTQWTPYYNVAGRIDVFNASWFNLPKQIFRRDNTLVYNTPDIAGFKAEAMLQMNGASQEDGVDEYNVGVNYANGPVAVGVGYISNEFNDSDSFVVTGGAAFGPVSFALIYEDGDYDASAAQDANLDDVAFYGGVVEYTFGSNILRAAYGVSDPDGDNDALDDVFDSDDDDETSEWAIGLQHNLSKRSRVWVEYSDVEDTQEALSIGMRHDF